MTTKTELAAEVYAAKNHTKIQDMKGIHGKTQLRFAFIAGAESVEMKWIPFEETKCPVNVAMIFLHEDNTWVAGNYINGSEYGSHIIIPWHGRRTSIKGITHYLIPILPQ